MLEFSFVVYWLPSLTIKERCQKFISKYENSSIYFVNIIILCDYIHCMCLMCFYTVCLFVCLCFLFLLPFWWIKMFNIALVTITDWLIFRLRYLLLTPSYHPQVGAGYCFVRHHAVSLSVKNDIQRYWWWHNSIGHRSLWFVLQVALLSQRRRAMLRVYQ